MTYYNVEGFCDDNGERFSLGCAIVSASDESEAEDKAHQELWDARLTAAGCGFRAIVEEVELNDGDEVMTPDGIGIIHHDDPIELGAGEGYKYPVEIDGQVEYYPEYDLTPTGG